MPHVVTQSCCSDASCMVACPVNCIHPGPTEDGFSTSSMVFIDPATCVDCGACVTACPVDAIKPHGKLTPAELPFLEINARYFDDNPHLIRSVLAPVHPRRALRNDASRLRVAIVGSGPAGMYAADEILRYPGATVDVYERLDKPYGLARYGVAPDHQRTRKIHNQFDVIASQPGFQLHLGIEVGIDITHEQLAAGYTAVIYTVGAPNDRKLDIPGEGLPGSMSATGFVGWYNGHPDFCDIDVNLDHERVVVIGNGNVALDVARILTADPESLAKTDIAPAALDRLRQSKVREVVLLGRRGPAEAAFTLPELVGLGALTDVDVVVENHSESISCDTQVGAALSSIAGRPAREVDRRIVLRFRSAPARILGNERVEGIEVQRTHLVNDNGKIRATATDETTVLEAGMVLRSIGFYGRPVDDLPFDEQTGTVPNTAGRVVPGTYVAGWIKRGPTGFLGTNRTCAQETVATLVADLEGYR